MDNVDQIVAKFYAILYLNICTKDFSQTLKDNQAQ